MAKPVLGVVGSAAGGVQELFPGLVKPALAAGWTVGVTLTPTAGRWLRDLGVIPEIEAATGLPVRDQSRLPHEAKPHPPADCHVVAPASANTVAKLALGISDNQALTPVNEAVGTVGVSIVVFPRVNAAHARHPAWAGHLAALRRAGVRLIYGEDVWPLHEPGDEPDREPPWAKILDAINATRPA
ncbi:MAG TPA: flavoprotein [Pseudonocardiaceae bacterium]|jgi:hypothetical protein|nr:flavoprotein [Pseudonocardiaceae bacterium]